MADIKKTALAFGAAAGTAAISIGVFAADAVHEGLTVAGNLIGNVGFDAAVVTLSSFAIGFSVLLSGARHRKFILTGVASTAAAVLGTQVANVSYAVANWVQEPVSRLMLAGAGGLTMAFVAKGAAPYLQPVIEPAAKAVEEMKNVGRSLRDALGTVKRAGEYAAKKAKSYTHD